MELTVRRASGVRDQDDLDAMPTTPLHEAGRPGSGIRTVSGVAHVGVQPASVVLMHTGAEREGVAVRPVSAQQPAPNVGTRPDSEVEELVDPGLVPLPVLGELHPRRDVESAARPVGEVALHLGRLASVDTAREDLQPDVVRTRGRGGVFDDPVQRPAVGGNGLARGPQDMAPAVLIEGAEVTGRDDREAIGLVRIIL